MRMMRMVLALGLSLALIPTTAWSDWAQVKKDFGRKYASADWSVKADAVRSLGEGDNSQACGMLAGVVAQNDSALTKAFEELEKLKKKFKPYAGMTKGTTDQINEKKRLQGEIDKQGELIANINKVLDAADVAMGQMSSEGAKKWLLKGLTKRPLRLQVSVANALGRIGGDDVVAPLVKGMKNRDPRMATACINALGAANAKDAAVDIAKQLKHRMWQIRAAAAQALGDIGAIDQIPQLIDQLDKERGRLEDDINAALVKLTGVDQHGNAIAWRAWYKHNKDTLANRQVTKTGTGAGAGPKKSGGSVTSFYGIETKSTSIIFVIDISGSMETPAGGTPGQPGAKPKPPVTLSGGGGGGDRTTKDPAEAVKGGRKIDVAKRELIRAIARLDHKTKFTIIWYNEDVRPWKEKMVAATPAIKKEAIAEVVRLEPKGATNIFDSVEKAFKLEGHAAGVKNFMKGADTIFLLSDGSPNKGRITDIKGIITEVGKMNATRKITIHTIGIGPGHNRQFMETLAKESGGSYVGRN